jgi:hypothetical protein
LNDEQDRTDGSAAAARRSVAAARRHVAGLSRHRCRLGAADPFLAAVLRLAWAGCAWRPVPEAAGRWNSVDQLARRRAKGVWQALTDRLAADADLKRVMLDRTVARAHACAAGAKRQKAGRRSAARAAGARASSTPPPTPSATLWPSA